MQTQKISKQIIILGAGIAGISAARNLAQKGHKIKIVEATDYIGGRMKTKNIKLQNNLNYTFDQGASWIHGSCKSNCITQLSKLINDFKMSQTKDNFSISFNHNGKVVQNSTLQNSVQQQQEIPRQMLVTSGYQKFPQYLANHQNIKVLLNHKVIQVIYENEKNEVKCQNGTSFLATHLIIALPIGILRSKLIKFQPQFSSQRKLILQKIVFVNVCKVFIFFKNQSLIKHKQHYLKIILDSQNKNNLISKFINLFSISSIPALFTLQIGQTADLLQKMSQKDTKLLILERINTILQEKITLNDFQIYKTNWKQRQNFGGAFSTLSSDNQKDNQNITKPMFQTNWYFCGEFIHNRHRGNVQGAYLSGQYAAQLILSECSQKNWKFDPDYNGHII